MGKRMRYHATNISINSGVKSLRSCLLRAKLRCFFLRDYFQKMFFPYVIINHAHRTHRCRPLARRWPSLQNSVENEHLHLTVKTGREGDAALHIPPAGQPNGLQN